MSDRGPSLGRLRGLHHVQLTMPAGAEREAEKFYAGVLRLGRVEKPPPLAGRGGCWFIGPHGAPEVHLGVAEPFVPARKAHPAFEVEGLDALAERLTAANVGVDWDDALSAGRRFYAFDPFGNRLEFVED